MVKQGDIISCLAYVYAFLELKKLFAAICLEKCDPPFLLTKDSNQAGVNNQAGQINQIIKMRNEVFYSAGQTKHESGHLLRVELRSDMKRRHRETIPNRKNQSVCMARKHWRRVLIIINNRFAQKVLFPVIVDRGRRGK